jgi:hypothetical protein
MHGQAAQWFQPNPRCRHLIRSARGGGGVVKGLHVTSAKWFAGLPFCELNTAPTYGTPSNA